MTVRIPFLGPATVGVNVTEILQLSPTPNVAPQVVVLAKSPLTTMLAIARVAVPVLLRLIVCEPLVVPTD